MGLYDEFKSNKITAHSIAAKIMVIGVGGAGGNAVDHIYEQGIKGVNLMICNTDIKALDKSPLADNQKICMGDGKGAGNDAETGRKKATESLAEIRDYVVGHNPDMIFLTAGMGGGTGTGATPVIAQMIHALDIPTIAILTTPPQNEGNHRFEQAASGIQLMKDFVDTFIIIKNETIIELYEHLPVREAFNKANDIVAFAAKGIAEIALTQSDLVSVDISDVCKVVRNSHCAVMGMATAESENRAIKAIDKAILSPLFGGAPITGATQVLINFATSSSDGLMMKEVNQALNHVQQMAATKDKNGNDIPTNVIWGTSIKPELGDSLEIIIVVAGFPANSFYSTAFAGKLSIGENSEATSPQEPQIPTPEVVTPTPIQEPQIEVKPEVKPTPISEPKPEVKPEPKPEVKVIVKPIEEVKPVQKVTIETTIEKEPIAQDTKEEQSGNEEWRVAMPARIAIAPIAIKQVPANIIKIKSKPAYITRRMLLISEVKGKKIVGKSDNVKTSNEVVDGSSQSFNF